MWVFEDHKMRGEAMEAETVPIPRPRRKARRGQRGSIIHRGDGWTIVFRAPDGKQKWQGGFRTKDDAQDGLSTTLKAIRDNKYVSKHIDFRAFCDERMSKRKPFLKPKTWLSYKSALDNHILPKFGDWPISEISRLEVRSFLEDMLARPDVSRKFVRNVHALMHKMFEDA